MRYLKYKILLALSLLLSLGVWADVSATRESYITEDFNSYSVASGYTYAKSYGMWNVTDGGVSDAKDVTDRMGSKALVLQYNSFQSPATMISAEKVKGFKGIDFYIATTHTSVMYKVQYSESGTTWLTLVSSEGHGDNRNKKPVSSTLASPVDAYVRIQVNYAASTGSSYRAYIDDVRLTVVTEDDTPDYTRALNGKIGTICLPRDVAEGDYSGVSFYEPAYLQMQNGVPYQMYFDEVSSLEAGRGYIYVPNSGASEMQVSYSGAPVASPLLADNEHPMQGTFTGIGASDHNELNDNYVISNNQFFLAESWLSLPANRAYIVAEYMSTQEADAPAPGRRRITMSAQGTDVVTVLVSAPVEDACRKLWHNGQLLIQRGGCLYTLQGQRVTNE